MYIFLTCFLVNIIFNTENCYEKEVSIKINGINPINQALIIIIFKRKPSAIRWHTHPRIYILQVQSSYPGISANACTEVGLRVSFPRSVITRIRHDGSIPVYTGLYKAESIVYTRNISAGIYIKPHWELHKCRLRVAV